jgi:hypothetical protein
MALVTSENKAEHDREFMQKRGQLKAKKPPSKYQIKPFYGENDKRNGWAVYEGDYVHDVYPTKKYAQNVISKWESSNDKK